MRIFGRQFEVSSKLFIWDCYWIVSSTEACSQSTPP